MIRLELPELLAKFAGAPLVTIPTGDLRLMIGQITWVYRTATDELRRRERKAAVRAWQAT